MAASLDTSLLLRLALRDVPKQYVTVRDLVTTPGARFHASDLAIDEAVHALTHHDGLSRPQVADIIRTLVTDPSIDTNRDVLLAAVGRFEAQPALSYADCYLAEEAHATGNEPLLTFDKKLASQQESAELATDLDDR